MVAEAKSDVLHAAVALNLAAQIPHKSSSAARVSTPISFSVANEARERKANDECGMTNDE